MLQPRVLSDIRAFAHAGKPLDDASHIHVEQRLSMPSRGKHRARDVLTDPGDRFEFLARDWKTTTLRDNPARQVGKAL